MKKLAMILSTIALAIPAPLVVATPAHADSNSATVTTCKEIVDAGYYPDLSVGECVAIITSETNYYKNGSTGYASHACKFYEEQFPDYFAATWDSYADCVQQVKSEL